VGFKNFVRAISGSNRRRNRLPPSAKITLVAGAGNKKEVALVLWYGNSNLFKPMGMILTDSRDLRMLETLIKLDAEHKDCTVTNCIIEHLKYDEFLTQLGVAMHPAQDKHGHHEYFSINPKEAGGLVTGLKNWVEHAINYGGLMPFDGDDVSVDYTIHGVKYYHWDNALRSRDASYDILRRFRMSEKYKGLFG